MTSPMDNDYYIVDRETKQLEKLYNWQKTVVDIIDDTLEQDKRGRCEDKYGHLLWIENGTSNGKTSLFNHLHSYYSDKIGDKHILSSVGLGIWTYSQWSSFNSKKYGKDKPEYPQLAIIETSYMDFDFNALALLLRNYCFVVFISNKIFDNVKLINSHCYVRHFDVNQFEKNHNNEPIHNLCDLDSLNTYKC